MAGMLPGVETARRRRLRGWCDSSSSSSSIGSSSFGSIRSARLSYDHDHTSSFLERNQLSDEDDNLGGAAREAKERLNGRLRGHLKSEIRRQNSQESFGGVGRRSNTTSSVVMEENLEIEVIGLKKSSGSKRFSWGRMGLNCKLSNQDCLQFA
ncbi:hypothetical protein OSB04_021046 [Centaurea solstitialis]|uniref:Uncharacterized protein n=1 Tax=Centaurea solstitialis TaxID=347529 RepID=A0AA38STU4_9ASTR|nr:hypothetical protein OSB04_021046 [Centaurea solstitialis]